METILINDELHRLVKYSKDLPKNVIFFRVCGYYAAVTYGRHKHPINERYVHHKHSFIQVDHQWYWMPDTSLHPYKEVKLVTSPPSKPQISLVFSTTDGN